MSTGGGEPMVVASIAQGTRRRSSEINSRLIIRRGPVLAALRELVKESGAPAVFWNRRYELAAIARNTQVKQGLIANGIRAESFNAALLWEPREIA